MTQAHVIISGFVQGVGYRQFVKSKARQLGLVGWVKNSSQATVEAVFVGSKEKIQEIIKECKKGPFLAEVKDIDVKWGKIKEQFDIFEIRHN